MPGPGDFVAKNGSKIRAWRSVGTPGPLSATVSTTRSVAVSYRVVSTIRRGCAAARIA